MVKSKVSTLKAKISFLDRSEHSFCLKIEFFVILTFYEKQYKNFISDFSDEGVEIEKSLFIWKMLMWILVMPLRGQEECLPDDYIQVMSLLGQEAGGNENYYVRVATALVTLKNPRDLENVVLFHFCMNF